MDDFPNLQQFWATKGIHSPYLANFFVAHCKGHGITKETSQDDIDALYVEWQEINSEGGECEIWLPPVLVGMVSSYIGLCPQLLIASVILTSLMPSILKRKRIGLGSFTRTVH